MTSIFGRYACALKHSNSEQIVLAEDDAPVMDAFFKPARSRGLMLHRR